MTFDLTESSQVEALSCAIPNAVCNAEAGFYYEEGGCWGFAAALFDLFTSAGILCEIQYRGTGFVHAVVAALGLHWDHQGAGAVNQSFESVDSIDALETLARTFGVSSDDFAADRDAASSILRNAIELRSMAT